MTLFGFALPLVVSSVLGVGVVASLLRDAGVVLYLVCAEVLAVLGAACQTALGVHSRAGTLEAAEARGIRDRVQNQLDREGSYVLTARLVRFLGSALLVVGIAYLLLGNAMQEGRTTEFPVGTLLLVVLITFGVTFLLNDALVRLLIGKDPDRFVASALGPLELFRFALAPLRIPLVWIARIAFRVRLESAGPSAREEVLETIEEGEREGSLSKSEAEMIESIIVLETRAVKDVMTPRPDMVMLRADTPLVEAADLIVEEGLSRIPVYVKDRDDVVGVIYARDVLKHLHQGEEAAIQQSLVRDVMRDSPFFVPENKPAGALLADMRDKKIHMAVVIDEFHGTTGLVTIEDLLEEIVGDIQDEHDDEEEDEAPLSTAEDIAKGTIDVEGRTPIEDVNRALSIELPVEDDFETMSGLLFHELGSVPQVGDRVSVAGIRLTVLEADERTVQRVRVDVQGNGDAE
ncbi:MAG: hemolysin family protein [Planctomycetota bacterium]|nr:hemolysin family protein [Planctomycetota bacterium]